MWHHHYVRRVGVAGNSIRGAPCATWLSPKALRLYDEKGLLSPDTVDPFSGYRKYSPTQVETARLITMLRRIDMPLDLVNEVLAATPAERAAQIARYRDREAEKHARRQALAQFIEHAVGTGSMEGEGQPGVSKFVVATGTVPEAPLLTSTRHTPAKDLPEVIQEEASKLFALAPDRTGAPGTVYQSPCRGRAVPPHEGALR